MVSEDEQNTSKMIYHPHIVSFSALFNFDLSSRKFNNTVVVLLVKYKLKPTDPFKN
jgi:hypothetical protein